MSETQPKLDTPALNVGDKLSQFEVVEQLGGGGSAVVWKAYDALLDRYVAIKQLLVAPDQEETFHARFRQEVAMLKQLSDEEPRLVKMIEHIDDERGAFIITEYVDGSSLEQFMTQTGEPSSVRGVMRILYALTQAMKTIHGKGVIHRDLKPSNILLPREGGLKVCDLGLAALVAEQEALTLGSARYMAPELFRGEHADGRADIYAVGFIIYEMLCGRTQFEKTFKTVVRDQRNQAMRWMKWHTNARLVAPALKEQNPHVPNRLSDLVGRMIEKDPAKRVGSATELEQAIERHFSHQQPTSAPTPAAGPGAGAAETEPDAVPQPAGDTAPLPQRRRWVWALAGSVAALVLVAVAGLMVMRSGPTGPDPIEQAGAALAAGEKAYNAGNYQTARDEYQAALNHLTGLDRDQPHPAQDNARAGLLAAKTRLAIHNQQFGEARKHNQSLKRLDDEAVDGKVLSQLERTLGSEQDVHAALDRIAEKIKQGQLSQARSLYDKWAQRNLGTANARLSALGLQLAKREKAAYVQAALDRANALLGQNKRDLAIEHLQKAKAEMPEADFYATFEKLGEQSALNTTAFDDRLAALKHEKRFDQATAQARQAKQMQDFDRAIEQYQKAIDLTDDAETKQQFQQQINDLKARRKVQLADRQFDLNNVNAAKEAYKAAMELAAPNSRSYRHAREQLDAIQHANQRDALIRQADAAYNAGRYEEAIKTYQQAINMSAGQRKQNLRSKLANTKVAKLKDEARQARQQGDYQTAKQKLQQARALPSDVNVNLDEVNQLLKYQQHLEEGDKLYDQGNYSQAKLAYRKAREIHDTDEVNQRYKDAQYQYLFNKAKEYIDAKKWRQARGTLLTIRNIRETDEVKQKLQEVEQNM